MIDKKDKEDNTFTVLTVGTYVVGIAVGILVVDVGNSVGIAVVVQILLVQEPYVGKQIHQSEYHNKLGARRDLVITYHCQNNLDYHSKHFH